MLTPNLEAANQVTVIMPAYNAKATIAACLQAVRGAKPYEIIVVDDGSTDGTRAIAESYGARVLTTGGRSGPAVARNLGAREAKGSILFFVDSDVQMYSDTVERVWRTFQDPAIDALMGAYDDEPSDPDFLSQYKNLMHCYVHRQGRRDATTFWSGCGAIRREVFLKHNGFSDAYHRPAIEDIELGYRLSQAGHKIRLDPELRVKHMKRWTFWGLVKTDVIDRGIPWSELILRDKKMPDDLNIQLSQRVSVALVYILILLALAVAIYFRGYVLVPAYVAVFLLLSRYWVDESRKRSRVATLVMYGMLVSICWICYVQHMLALIPITLASLILVAARHRATADFQHKWVKLLIGAAWVALAGAVFLIFSPMHPFLLVLALLTLAVVILNSQFYVFLARKQGPLFALSAIPFHLLYHFYNGISFVVGSGRFLLASFRGPEARHGHR